ncbi:OmpW family protein [Pigmentiphaga soli]|uniref:OmpW family protein n=1 Tax=Pigmentiphaga soli TaxID=1007095 RepID=A0ABP8H5S2_9BURK
MLSRLPLRSVAAALLAAGAAFGAHAQGAPDGRWLVRARAVNLDSANKDSTGLGLSINDKVLPEVDVSYFFTPQVAAELVLTYPQLQDIRSNGSYIGSLRHLPPTLTVQYHFTNLGAFKPYVGAGINYTRFSHVKFEPAVATALGPSIDKNSFGWALQAGLDYEIAKNTYLNFDVKKVQIRTDVMSFGNKAGTFKVDPWLVGIGIGKRF